MKVGIGLPNAVPDVNGFRLVEWAAKADSDPFSCLGTLDRLVYPNFDSLVVLAAASAVTRRVRLVTNILIAPLRNAGVLAKQAASLDAISGGRLTLGLGVGSRESDYLAAPEPFHTRGRRFEEQLATMKRVWAGQPVAEGVGHIGPAPARPGGPELLIGGVAPAAVARVGRWGDGFIGGGSGDPARALELYRMAERSWAENGRPGKPRWVGHTYFALGPHASERSEAWVRHFYSYRKAALEAMLGTPLISPEAIRKALQRWADIGMDELILMPCTTELDQIDRLAALIVS